MEVPQKAKNRSTIQTSQSTPGYLLKGLQVNIAQRYLCIGVYCSARHPCQVMEPNCVSIYRGLDRENAVYMPQAFSPKHEE